MTGPFLGELLAVVHAHLDTGAGSAHAGERPQRIRAGSAPGARRALLGHLVVGTASRVAPDQLDQVDDRSMTSSSVYGVVSMCTAPSAITSGEAARPESIRSRASSDSSVAATSEPPSSAARRAARAAASAVR